MSQAQRLWRSWTVYCFKFQHLRTPYMCPWCKHKYNLKICKVEWREPYFYWWAALPALATVVLDSVPWKRARSETSRTHSALNTEATPAKFPAESSILHFTALGIYDRCAQADGRKELEKREGCGRWMNKKTEMVWHRKYIGIDFVAMHTASLARYHCNPKLY